LLAYYKLQITNYYYCTTQTQCLDDASTKAQIDCPHSHTPHATLSLNVAQADGPFDKELLEL